MSEPRREPVTLWVGGLTHPGESRFHNEDCFSVSELCGPLQRGPADVVERLTSAQGFVLGVYDGTGGVSTGSVASTLAAKTVTEALATAPTLSVEALRDALIGAIHSANQAILTEVEADQKHRGMGTTATVAAQTSDQLFLAQIGDSRAYVLRGHALVQVTRDDTLVNEALRTGNLRLEDVADFPHKSVILQALGMGTKLNVGLSTVDLRFDDALLLCTDGLHGLLDDSFIRAIMLRHRAPGVAVRVLLDEARKAGGHDNLAIIVARFESPSLRPVTHGDTLEDRGLHLPH